MTKISERTREVLRETLKCALAWSEDARILGNVRAGDMAEALHHVLRVPPNNYTPQDNEMIVPVFLFENLLQLAQAGLSNERILLEQDIAEKASDAGYDEPDFSKADEVIANEHERVIKPARRALETYYSNKREKEGIRKG
jgi:hypothetical protein